MQLKIKKKHPWVPTPFYATAGSACFDLHADSVEPFNEEFGYWQYNTGLSFEIPQGYVGLIFPRSSISNTHQTLANCVGVIDSDYRGEVSFRFRNAAVVNARLIQNIGNPITDLPQKVVYQIGERIGQMMILPVTQVNAFVVVDELSGTERGNGGYGSTGTADLPIIEE